MIDTDHESTYNIIIEGVRIKISRSCFFTFNLCNFNTSLQCIHHHECHHILWYFRCIKGIYFCKKDQYPLNERGRWRELKLRGAAPAWKHNHAEQLAQFMWLHPLATEEERARSIGVSRTTLWRYWKDENFCSAVVAASDSLTARAQPLVDAALVRKAVGGDVTAIRLFYQLRGELSDKCKESHLGDAEVTVTIKRARIEED